MEGWTIHPFHAHGGHYYDIGSKFTHPLALPFSSADTSTLNQGGNGSYSPTLNEKKLADYTPVLRDTTNLYRYTTVTTAGAPAGWRGWRLRVQDPGVWMIHCQ